MRSGVRSPRLHQSFQQLTASHLLAVFVSLPIRYQNPKFYRFHRGLLPPAWVPRRSRGCSASSKLRFILSSLPPVFWLGKTNSLLRFKPLSSDQIVSFIGTERFLPDLLSLTWIRRRFKSTSNHLRLKISPRRIAVWSATKTIFLTRSFLPKAVKSFSSSSVDKTRIRWLLCLSFLH